MADPNINLPTSSRITGYIVAAIAAGAAICLVVKPPATSVFPPQCASVQCLTSVATVPNEIVLTLIAVAVLSFWLSLNGLKLASIKFAGGELTAVPPVPSQNDVNAVEADKPVAEETDSGNESDTDAPAATSLTRTVGSVSTFRLEDVPFRVVADALSNIEKQAPDPNRTMSSVAYFLRKPGKGQPWFVKLTDGQLWRIAYTGRRESGASGTASVKRIGA